MHQCLLGIKEFMHKAPTEVVTAFTEYSCSIFHQGWMRGSGVPIPCCGGEEMQVFFSLRVWHLVCSSWWSYIYEYVGTTNHTQRVIKKRRKKDQKLGGVKGHGWIWEKLKGRTGVNVIKLYCIRAWNSQNKNIKMKSKAKEIQVNSNSNAGRRLVVELLLNRLLLLECEIIGDDPSGAHQQFQRLHNCTTWLPRILF